MDGWMDGWMDGTNETCACIILIFLKVESIIRMYDSKDRTVAFTPEVQFALITSFWPPSWISKKVLRVFFFFFFSNTHVILPRRLFRIIRIGDILLMVIQEHLLRLFKLPSLGRGNVPCFCLL